MKTRRHHNNDGRRQVRTGRLVSRARQLARVLGVRFDASEEGKVRGPSTGAQDDRLGGGARRMARVLGVPFCAADEGKVRGPSTALRSAQDDRMGARSAGGVTSLNREALHRGNRISIHESRFTEHAEVFA